MRKVVLFILALFLTIQVQANLDMVRGNHVVMGYGTKGATHGGKPKAPASPWFIELDNNVISMTATPCDYTLNLYDEDGDVVYTAFIPAGTSSVILPATLSGDFEIRFETDTYYYYGFISL